jgi:hypothetical protein
MTPFAALLRALRGPLMLIALGALMAAHQAYGYHLSKTWPALLILLGLTKLAERLTDRASLAGTTDSPGGPRP